MSEGQTIGRSITDQPPCTFVAEIDECGRCFIPDAFAPEFQKFAAALDWARVFNTQQQHNLTSVELDAAAAAAREIAAMCDRFSAAAREQS